VETALVFLAKLAVAITCIVSESQTNIKGLAPIEPVTTLFLWGQMPNEIISSIWPTAYFSNPSPMNLCLSVFVFITIPKAAAG
jgi:hypothetical protein